MSNQEYDVFLSHNSLDKEVARTIVYYLREQGLKIWFDENQIYVGESLPQAIENAIWDSKSAAICIGNYGLGKWQKEELEILKERQIKQNQIIFPILLLGVPDFPDQREFLWLRRLKYVALTSDNHEQALDELIQGIRNYLNQWATKELKRLRAEKEEAEKELRRIEEEIDRVKTKLETQTMERKKALDWLGSVKNTVEIYGKKALKSFSALEMEVQEKPHKRDEFYKELEVCMDFVYYTFRDENYSYLDEMLIELSLADSFQVYEAAIDLIIREIPGNDRLSKETKNELEDYLDRLKRRILLLV